MLCRYERKSASLDPSLLQGQYFLHTNQLVSLSEKQLVDCSKSNRGCHGGLPQRAFYDIKQMGGLGTEENDPYIRPRKHKDCHFKPKNAIVELEGHVHVNKSEEDLKAAVALMGPISVGIALSPDLRHYHNGVFDGCRKSDKIKHAALLVGYGSERGQDYWLVKNSWGLKWGDQGYIKIARNAGNMCHIANQAYYPKIHLFS